MSTKISILNNQISNKYHFCFLEKIAETRLTLIYYGFLVLFEFKKYIVPNRIDDVPWKICLIPQDGLINFGWLLSGEFIRKWFIPKLQLTLFHPINANIKQSPGSSNHEMYHQNIGSILPRIIYTMSGCLQIMP